jgi:aspartyl protease family protein
MPALPQLDPAYIVAGAALGLVALLLIARIPFIGTAIRTLVSLALVAAVALVLVQRASIDPTFADLAGRFNLGGQEVVGKEVRVKMAPNGHFYINADINGIERRMLIDSGATVTALSTATAAAAGLDPKPELVPVILQTANGAVQAETAEVPELRVGNIVARDLKVVVSPAFGRLDVIGMNFLSRLKSWRVEGRTLVLVPHHPQKAG